MPPLEPASSALPSTCPVSPNLSPSVKLMEFDLVLAELPFLKVANDGPGQRGFATRIELGSMPPVVMTSAARLPRSPSS